MLGLPMQEGLVIELARQLLAAVQFLHDNDVVHDDLHPGNVLIVDGKDRPIVKISDFGISTELRGLPAIRPNVVHHAIMAPEIIATGYTGKQSDIYQIGLLLYWMLTGRERRAARRAVRGARPLRGRGRAAPPRRDHRHAPRRPRRQDAAAARAVPLRLGARSVGRAARAAGLASRALFPPR